MQRKKERQELFHHTPVFYEPVLNFASALVDPRDNAALNAKVNSGGGCSEFNQQAARFKRDIEDLHEPQNHWTQILKLVENKVVQEAVFQRKQEYEHHSELQRLRKSNLPFFYVHNDHLRRLKDLQRRTEEPGLKQEVQKQAEHFENVLKHFKQQNPHLFKPNPKQDSEVELKLDSSEKLASLESIQQFYRRQKSSKSPTSPKRFKKDRKALSCLSDGLTEPPSPGFSDFPISCKRRDSHALHHSVIQLKQVASRKQAIPARSATDLGAAHDKRPRIEQLQVRSKSSVGLD